MMILGGNLDASIAAKYTVLEMTPVDFRGGVYLKREDLYAPFGIGNVNGSKVRQCIYLFSNYLSHGGNKGLVSGASVKSSQIPLGTIIAKELGGLPSVHVIGATTPKAAIRNEQVAIADYYGAKFQISRVAYNPVLQYRAKSLAKELDWFYLEYGSAINHAVADKKDVLAYHQLGANQVQNIPDDVETLIVPTGSCNTLISIILGIAYFRPEIEILCLQIGPDKQDYVAQRLNVLNAATGLDLASVKRTYIDLTQRWQYRDNVSFDFNGIYMHPTYEGKCFLYLSEHPELLNPKSCFWLTGAMPELRLIDPEFIRPDEIQCYDS